MTATPNRTRGVHLGEDELHPATRRCIMCGGTDLKRGAQLQANPDVWLLACPLCHIASASHLPTADVYEALYCDYYGGAHSQESGVTAGNPVRLARHIFKGTGHLPGSSVSILDFGGGDGTVSMTLGEMLLDGNFDRVDIEIVDPARRVARSRSARMTAIWRSDLDSVTHREFDVVLASAVLEHVLCPAESIEQLLMCLGAGGVFYARTACHLPLAHVAERVGRHFDFGYPMHLHSMGQDFWERSLETLGLEDRFELVRSKPSTVVSSLGKRFVRTIAAHAMKAPWYLRGRRYTLVGGWEVFIQRIG